MILKTDYLLAVILVAKERVSFDSLTELQGRIEAACPGVVVDVSSPGIHSALHAYPGIFQKQGPYIERASHARRYLSSNYLDWEFTGDVPSDVHARVVEVIHERVQ